MRSARASFLFAVALLAGGWPADPQSQYETPAKLQRLQGERSAKLWAKELDKAERYLLEGQHEKAHKKASGVVRQITDTVLGGPGVAGFFGRAMAMQAIAAVELGRRDEGLWQWQVATQFIPALESLDLSAFGEAGAILTDLGRDPQIPPFRREGAFTEPVWTKQPDPRWPRAKLDTPTVRIVLEVTMGADGKLRSPKIVDAAGELTMVCAALETMRRWEFEPARIDGKAVPVRMRQTFVFRVRG